MITCTVKEVATSFTVQVIIDHHAIRTLRRLVDDYLHGERGRDFSGDGVVDTIHEHDRPRDLLDFPACRRIQPSARPPWVDDQQSRVVDYDRKTAAIPSRTLARRRIGPGLRGVEPHYLGCRSRRVGTVLFARVGTVLFAGGAARDRCATSEDPQ